MYNMGSLRMPSHFVREEVAWAYRTVRQSDCPTCMRDVGLKMAVVSNFDLRLRPLLEGLGLDQPFDALIISAEVSYQPSDCPTMPLSLPERFLAATKIAQGVR